MKQFLFLLVILGAIEHLQASPIRRIDNINREWKFALGDYKQAALPVFDDEGWETVGLPHSFSIPYFMSNDFYMGYGWYRKLLNFTKKELEKKLFLEFDGVFQEAELFVNGKLIDTHVGGYTGFSIDISDAVTVGDNLIAIRVNNLWKPDIAPRAGEHVFSGGIYRNVRLVIKSPTHIDWYGTYVTTPSLSKNQGLSSEVKIETEVHNQSEEDGIYKLLTQVFSPDGEIVATVNTQLCIAASCSMKFVQTTEQLQNPQLWSPSTPVLYKVVSKLYKDRQLIDEDETAFGFRWFEWTADKGFFLNGTHLKIKGVNVHQDQAGWGDAVTESAMHRDVKMMKEAGFNLIRGSHYPHAPAFSRACDEEGILFWSEAPFWGIGGFKSDGYWNSSAYPIDKNDEAGFEESALQQLGEMIRIHRNHPSIVVWSMCNEAFFSVDEAMPGVHRLLKRMVALSHQLDSTRPAAIGGAQRPLGDERIDRIGDLAGYNGDGATQPDFQNPGIPNLVSEYGSVTSERPGEYAPGWGDLKRDDGWKGYAWRSGQAIWCGFDHGSIAGSALGKMGIVDYFRIPKRSWYWYRNEFAGIVSPEWPVKGTGNALKLEASVSYGIKTDGTDDVQLLVSVRNDMGKIVNHSPVVTLNVISGPGEFPTGRSISFAPDSDIRIIEGQAAISFRSYYAGKTVIEATSSGLKSTRIEIEFEGKSKYRQGKTPIVEQRPYVRFVREKEKRDLQTFGRNNPTFASSNENRHAPGMAADGNLQTYWKSSNTDEAPYWILDTEKKLSLYEIQLCFPEGQLSSYVVEVSSDKITWKNVSENAQKKVDELKIVLDVSNQNLTGRFVRLLFKDNKKAVLSEIAVKGEVLE